MSDPILPYDVWPSQITQASVPANRNALRAEILDALVISKTVTAQPLSPSNGDLYIIPAGATGAQWSTFDENDLAIYRDGWYAFAPSAGILKKVGDEFWQWQLDTAGGSWVFISSLGATNAIDISYDNSTYPGWTPTNVQEAIDELKFEIDNVEVTETSTIGAVFDGGGSVIEVGASNQIFIPYDCTITACTMLADQTGSIEIDIQVDSYANYPPDGADSITGASTPQIGASNKSQNNLLSDWTTTINAGSVMKFVVNSCDTITRCSLILTITK